MTSRTLVERISAARFFGERKVQISPSEVYAAADDAQRELCTECELLQKRIQIGLIVGQDSYSFTTKTVTSIAQAPGGEGVLTIGAHDFNVGDMVHVSDVGGDCDGAQKVSAITATTITLEDTANPPGAYTGSLGRVYHYLSSVIRPKGKIGYLVSDTGAKTEIHRTNEQTGIRYGVDSFTESGKPLYYWLTFESTLNVRVQPAPSAAYTMYLTVYRKPLPSEVVSASIDPVLDSDYDRALYTGSLFYAISQFRREPGSERYIADARADFEYAKQVAMTVRAKKEATVDDANDPDDLRAP